MKNCKFSLSNIAKFYTYLNDHSVAGVTNNMNKYCKYAHKVDHLLNPIVDINMYLCNVP